MDVGSLRAGNPARGKWRPTLACYRIQNAAGFPRLPAARTALHFRKSRATSLEVQGDFRALRDRPSRVELHRHVGAADQRDASARLLQWQEQVAPRFLSGADDDRIDIEDPRR